MSAHSEVLPQERKHEILTRLRTEGRVSAAQLAGMFDISEDSIRRDLRELAARGLCRRVYGGALLPSTPLSPFRQRQEENAPRKQALAKVAASLVQPNQVLLIDAGSTNNAIAAALPERHGLTVATNAPSIAQQLMAREGFEVMLVGGRIDISAGGSMACGGAGSAAPYTCRCVFSGGLRDRLSARPVGHGHRSGRIQARHDRGQRYVCRRRAQ